MEVLEWSSWHFGAVSREDKDKTGILLSQRPARNVSNAPETTFRKLYKLLTNF